jgi:hypothetical protein
MEIPKEEDSQYFDIDLGNDNIQAATARLYKPPRQSMAQRFFQFFNCLSRSKVTRMSDDLLPSSDLSTAEPLSPFDKSPG